MQNFLHKPTQGFFPLTLDGFLFTIKILGQLGLGCWGEDSNLKEAERLRPTLRARPKAGLSVLYGPCWMQELFY
jgi:hypothetical protein